MMRFKQIRSLLYAGMAISAGLILPPVLIAMAEGPESAPPPKIATPITVPADSSKIPISARNNDCGAACLYMVCRLVGRPASLDVLRRETHTTDAGTSLLHLRDTARNLGFETRAIRGDFATLAERVAGDDAFAILHVRGNHFIVAEGATADGALRVLDPSREAMLVTEEELRERYRWEGVMLCLTDAGEGDAP